MRISMQWGRLTSFIMKNAESALFTMSSFMKLFFMHICFCISQSRSSTVLIAQCLWVFIGIISFQARIYNCFLENLTNQNIGFQPYQFTLTLLWWSATIKIPADKDRNFERFNIYQSNDPWSFFIICQVYPLCQMIINTSLFKRLKVSETTINVIR